MNQIDEYFNEEELEQLNLDKDTYYKGAMARQKLEVYDAREKLAKLSEMIEELKSIEGKVEAIQKFAIDNGIADMVSFCPWSNPMSVIDDMLSSSPVDDAMEWMHSNHNC